MANLIISIIAIALVAVAALMGAYYGGQAFQEAQMKGNINAVMYAMTQIAGAWKLQATENGGTFDGLTAGDSTTRIVSNLVPQYLSETPLRPRNITPSGSGYVLRSTSNFYDGSSSTIDAVGLYVTKDFCTAFANYIGNDTNGPTTSPANRNVTAVGSRPVDCYWYDLNTNGTQDTTPTDQYVVLYEVW